jgi:transposase
MRNKQKSKEEKEEPKSAPQLRVHKLELTPTPDDLLKLNERFTMKKRLYNLLLTHLYTRVNRVIRLCTRWPLRIPQVLYQYLATAYHPFLRDKSTRSLEPFSTRKRNQINKQIAFLQILVDRLRQQDDHRTRQELVFRLMEPLMQDQKLRNEFVTDLSLNCRKRDTPDESYNKMTRELHRLQKMAPKDIRLFVIDSLVKAFESNVAKRKINPRHRFTMHYKQPKDDQDSITMEYKSVKIVDQKLTIFGSTSTWRIGPMPMKEPFCASVIQNNVSISRCHGKYYVLLLYDLKQPELLEKRKRRKLRRRRKTEPIEEVVALDPGVRKAFTYYSPEGSCGYIGVGLNSQTNILKLQNRLSSLKGRVSSARDGKRELIGPLEEGISKKRVKRQRARKRATIRRLHEQITRYVDDCQWKTCHWLLARYRTILLPKLSVSRLVKRAETGGKKRRKLSNRSCQEMLMLGHGKFSSRLQQKAVEYTDRAVIPACEAWSSKTCGVCGTINEHLGAAEVFTCTNPQCNTGSYDRDVHAARNIYLRWLTHASI